jgi:DNA-binding HxlR family transcriptional regulator
VRAGAQALSLLAVPLNVHVLEALREEPSSLIDLRRAIGSPPPTTARGYLRTLSRTNIVARSRRNEFPRTVDYELAGPGRELLAVSEVLREWLALAPQGALEPGTRPARSAIKALVDGWATNMMRALAARQLSLTELSGLIAKISYPALERRVTAMRLAGLIEACPGGGRSTPYAVTEWLRRSIAPLAAAMRWERAHARQESKPLGRRDAEALFLLAAPLLQLDPDADGACRLAVELSNGEERLTGGVTVKVRHGRVTSCVARLDGDADAWVVGRSNAWLDAIVGGDVDRLDLGGDFRFARSVAEAFHRDLFIRKLAEAV